MFKENVGQQGRNIFWKRKWKQRGTSLETKSKGFTASPMPGGNCMWKHESREARYRHEPFTIRAGIFSIEVPKPLSEHSYNKLVTLFTWLRCRL